MTEADQMTDTLYDRLIRLKPDGLSTRAWTINAGVSSAFFDNLAAGGKPREGELPKVLAVVGITLAEFEGRGRPASPAAPASPPALSVLPRPPKAPAEPGSGDAPPASGDLGGNDDAAPETPRYAAATSDAIARWLEAQRQATAAGLDTSGPEGLRLVSDIARLALDLEGR